MKAVFRLQNQMGPGECAMILSPISRRYLTNFRSSDGVLLVTREKISLYLDSRYLEMGQIAKREGKIDPAVNVLPTPASKDLLPMVENGTVKTLLYEDEYLTVARLRNLEKAYPGAEFSPLGKTVEKMRVIKTEEEIRRIAAAQALAEETYLSVLPKLHEGMSERNVAAELEYYMKLHGASPSFGTICVSGTRSSLPHGGPTETLLVKGGFVTMDFGCLLDGYCSDMTRTVCIGKATDEMRHVYDTVLQAQEKAIAAVRQGVTGKEVDDAARNHIKEAGFGEYFGHSTGHGIGLEVHEAPSFSCYGTDPISAGAVLSVEPGIYLPGKFGVRIEDLVVVREGFCENLNHTSKELLEL